MIIAIVVRRVTPQWLARSQPHENLLLTWNNFFWLNR